MSEWVSAYVRERERERARARREGSERGRERYEIFEVTNNHVFICE